MKRSTVTLLGARTVRTWGGALAVLLAACAGGDDNITSGFSGFASNPGSSNPTAPNTSNSGSSGDSSGDEGGSTMPVDPTTGAPMTTTPMTSTEPMTTGPATTDATSTTTGNTTNTTTTTGNTTNNTTTTTTTDGSSSSSTTNPPPPPPPKDPQPANGLYQDCAANDNACNPNLTDGCFGLQDQNMVKIDGYCTLICNTDADCQPKPVCPAVSKCVTIAPNQNVCMLQCNGLVDCPTGMTCESVNVNGQAGKYCW
jgi:hypothetical protein